MEPEDEAVTLLLKALESLPAPEREQVLTMLVRRGLTAPAAPAWVALGSGATGSVSTGFGAARPPAGEQQLVPVRFPAEQHAQLKQWCGENGYPMAAVVRGLVDRFLSDQTPATSG